MKEEVGMKRRGALGALAGWVVVGMLVCSGTSAFGQEDIYENLGGLTSSGLGGGAIFPLGGAAVAADFSQAGPTYNPNGIGQYLFGQYYDVRPVAGDAQVTNLAIVNTNSNNANLPTCTLADVVQGRDGENCFFNQGTDELPKGGILAKVRFRESRYSTEVLDFNIALSCGEVWTARVTLGADGFPRLTSESLVVTSANGAFGGEATLRTRPAFNPAIGNGQPAVFRFAGDAPRSVLVPADAQRGYIEVIGIADLPCEPVDDDGEPTDIDLQSGNTWDVDSNFMATNALAAEAYLVRAASGVSYGYPFDAISRFRPVVYGPGGTDGPPFPLRQPITLGNIFGNEQPNIDNCLGFDLLGAAYSGVDCTRQFNLALHKGRLVGQYDISETTAGKTNFVITLPTKYRNCNTNPNSGALTKRYLETPFQCIANPGEEITCTVYDRLENLAEGGFTSPSETERCFLPRELTIFGMPGSVNADDILTLADSFETPSGWVAIELDDDTSGEILHREIFPSATRFDILGGRVQGYRGLPALAIKLQQYENGNAGGTYGTLVKMQADDPILFIGQS